jgi:hypothetical protein
MRLLHALQYEKPGTRSPVHSTRKPAQGLSGGAPLGKRALLSRSPMSLVPSASPSLSDSGPMGRARRAVGVPGSPWLRTHPALRPSKTRPFGADLRQEPRLAHQSRPEASSSSAS